MWSRCVRYVWALLCCAAVLVHVPTQAQTAVADAAPTQPCRVPGIEQEVRCGSLQRPLDPARPGGTQITIQYVVWPAVSARKFDDPVFLLAGGPGQSAIQVSPSLRAFFLRLNYRRDIVFVDQRGTGRSAPLECDDDAERSNIEAADLERQVRRIDACRDKLVRLPYGDLRFFTTTLAMQDLDAVRASLGAEQVNLVGASYGTRAALEYLRLYPARVRRMVIDGIAPPDMALPASFSTDSQKALDTMFAACGAEAACAARYPQLRDEWSAVLTALPRPVDVPDPLTGAPTTLSLTKDIVLAAVRAPLYAPVLAAALPEAIHQAAQGRFEALVGLSGWAAGPRRGGRLATGMHFSVVCAEDMPRLDASRDQPGTDFGSDFAELYRRACAHWPRGEVPSGFYQVPGSDVAALLLSGGLDPVTPPRHGERVAAALGPKARHVEVPNAGHGVLSVPCMREVVTAFIHAPDDALALRVDLACAYVPRPFSFRPLGPAAVPGRQ